MQLKKFPFPSMHVNVDDFIPATDAEKEYMVQMRPSSTFFKDGVKRRTGAGKRLFGIERANDGVAESTVLPNQLDLGGIVLLTAALCRILATGCQGGRQQQNKNQAQRHYAKAASALGTNDHFILLLTTKYCLYYTEFRSNCQGFLAISRQSGTAKRRCRFGSIRYGSVTATAEDQQCDDEDPNPVIAKEIAQTAVVHNKCLRFLDFAGGFPRPRTTII